jgi:cytochrome c oxidase subunit IV
MPVSIWQMLSQVWDIVSFVLNILYHTAFIWLPIVLGMFFIKTWLNYVRTDFMHNQGYFFLEIRLPREIKKTPLAMEVFLHGLWQKPPSTYIDTYWTGKVQPWFSLELVSLGGQVKFFIWGPKKYQPIAEAQLYAQYPDTELVPVEDYTNAVIHDLDKVFIWSSYFKLTNKDVYPIKTYVDYGLDRAEAKEETKTDPMTALIEFMGSIRPTDQLWMQFLIQGHHPRKPAMHGYRQAPAAAGWSGTGRQARRD